MWNKIFNNVVSAVVVLGLVFPAPLFAQESEEPESEIPLDLRITTLATGEVAPFSGLLLTPASMVKMRFDYQLKFDLLENDLQYQLRLSQSELEATQRLWDIERGMYTDQLASRNSHIDNLEDVLVRKRDLTPLWVALGFVGGAMATIGITYAVTGALE